MEYSKKEIIEFLTEGAQNLTSWYVDRPVEVIELGPEGAWTAGRHLLHMIKSTKPLAVGIGYPRLILRLKFGKVTALGLGYEELVKKYTDAISAGG
ncbi:MAG: hypothetical protein ACI9EQ_000074 [Bacteroidia bacterium]|jgi:hypothetical protein